MEGISDISTQHTSVDPYIRRTPNIKTQKIIKDFSEQYDVPFEIVLGVYLIETKCRPYWFRIIEYLYLFLRVFLSYIFYIRIPNITVGKFQIGLATILKYHNVYLAPI